MKLSSITCPRCNAELEELDNLDMFYCPYCGQKIVLEDNSRRKAKVTLRSYERDETIARRGYERDEYIARIHADINKTESIQVTNRVKTVVRGKTINEIAPIAFMAILLIVSLTMLSLSSKKREKETERVTAIYQEAQQLLFEKDYDEAYLKASLIVYNSSISSNEAEEWDKKRKKLIKEIDEATGKVHEKITLPQKASYYRGQDYKDVKTAFETMGFIDVTTDSVFDTPLSDVFIGDYEVLSVSINGISDFKEGTMFEDDAIVVIRYKVK